MGINTTERIETYDQGMLLESITALANEAGIEWAVAQELMFSYVKDLPTFMRTVKETALLSDYELLKKLVHQLKGASQNYRLHCMLPLILTFEKVTESRDHLKCVSLADELYQVATSLAMIVEEGEPNDSCGHS